MQELISAICDRYASDITGFTHAGHKNCQSFKYGVCDSDSTQR